jgi:serine/threonine-protein kinase
MANPYEYRGPIRDPARFFNRTAEIMRVSSRIITERPQSVSIVGAPRTGKTSLLNWLCDPGSRATYLREPDRYVYLLVCLEDDPPASPEAFFARFQAVAQRDAGIAMGPTFDGLNELVKGLMQEGRRLVVFLDDFGLVTSNTAFTLDFFSFMRSMANSHEVGYVTTSSVPLQQLCHTPDIEESPFFNIFTTVNLKPFKEEDARRLIEEPARGCGSPFAEETDWILELAGMQPYLLQLTAGVAFDLRAGGRLTRTALHDQAYKEACPYLSALWHEGPFPEAQQEVLRAVAAGKPVERQYQFAVDSLIRHGHLEKRDDGYVFTAGLLERFVKEQTGGFWKRVFRA